MTSILLEQRTERKPLVIYHSNCADGFSAAWCFHNTGMDYDFHPGVYSKPPPEDIEGRDIYLVDFSYKREVVENMLKRARSIWLIDHHKTALYDLEGLTEEYLNFYTYTDLSRSGAMLAWDFLNNVSLNEKEEIESEFFRTDSLYYIQPPLLLDHIQDRDLWKFKLPNTREISAALFSYDYTFEKWDDLMSFNYTEILKLSVAGAAIERKHHKDIAELVKVCKRMMRIGANVVPVASLPYTYSSDAGHLMTKEYENGVFFAACYWDTSEGRTFSLRSTEWGTDVSLVAAHYGGGGHKNAAGFTVPRTHPLASS